jgi:glycosyltransferase involved in cell wall biosynthesis
MPPDRRATSAIPGLLHAQLVGLRERHQVTLVTVAGPDAAEVDAVERFRSDGLEVHAAVRTLRNGTLGWARRARIARSWLGGGMPLRTAWFAEPEIQAKLDALAETRGFDAAIVEDNAMGVFRLPADVPALLTEHEVRRSRAVARPPGAPSAWPRWAFAEADWRRWAGYQRRVWSQFDVLQVFTERDAGRLCELAPELAERVRVNPFAVELPAALDAVEEPDTIAFVGNYTHPPNVDAALWLGRDIVPRIAALHPSVRLSLIGPYAPPEVRGLEGPRVRVLGAVRDLESLLRRTCVVVAPVRTGGGMRMKVLHAMALSKPVVTTRRGAEGLGLDGVAAPIEVAANAEGLARSCVRLLRDAGARHALGARARAYVEMHHSPEVYVRRLEQSLAAAAR